MTLQYSALDQLPMQKYWSYHQNCRLGSAHVSAESYQMYKLENAQTPRSRNLHIKMWDRLHTAAGPDIGLIRNSFRHLVNIVQIPLGIPGGIGANRVRTKSLFQIVSGLVTGRHLGAIPPHQISKLRTVAQLHKKGKEHSHKGCPTLSRASQNLHLMSSFFALLSKDPFQTPPDEMGRNSMLSLSLR